MEIGIREEAAELIDMAFPKSKTKAIFKDQVKLMMCNGATPKEAVAEEWCALWEAKKKQGMHAGPRPTQAYISML